MSYTIKTLEQIAKKDWDEYYEFHESPFFEHAFFDSLENSGSIIQKEDWQSLHLQSEKSISPAYLKYGSQGDFAWDWNWAHISTSSSIAYYPKLVLGIPATPYGGYDLLARPEDKTSSYAELIDVLKRLSVDNEIPNIQFLFPSGDFSKALFESKIPHLLHQKFLWNNYNYQNFDDFLAKFDKNQRKNIRRERREVVEAGIEVRVIEKNYAQFTDLVWTCYEKTQAQFGQWAAKFLNRAYFENYLSNAETKNLVLMIAFKENTPIAMAFLLRKGSQMFGRYWGSLEDIPFLHFELCFYAPIEYAITNGIKTYDPGAGGDHKLRRGFEPCEDKIFQWSLNPDFRSFFEKQAVKYNNHIKREIEQIAKELPFKA